MLSQITPIILTFNEEVNLERTLSALSWAKEVLIVDSYSTDNTLAICQQFTNTRVVQRRFDSASQQCNFALDQALKTPWVLSMDADYIVTEDLQKELSLLQPGAEVSGFQIHFEYLVDGAPLKGSLYPPRTCLYRADKAHYRQDGHTQRVVIDGLVSTLGAKLQHDDRKPFTRWLGSQKRYAKQEASKLAQSQWSELAWPDRLRMIGVAPLAVVPYTLIVKGLIINGWPGLVYTWQRFLAECYLQIARFKRLKVKSEIT